MALSFPLTHAQFWGLLPISSCIFDPREAVTSSRTRGGQTLRAERAARLWAAEVRLGPMIPAEAAAVLPLINLLRGGAGSFMASDPMRQAPRNDPAGTALGSAAPSISALSSNSRELALKGLPSGYMLQRGDLLAFSYGTSPIRYALHQIVNASVKANASGITPNIEVVPPIRPGAVVDAAVSLIQPACKMEIEPGSYQAGSLRSGGLVEGVSFSIQQTLR
ncbi:hypothetical protein [Paracoccus contaminans]|uniref:Uncharacterized protein n=1 Tax=Paracoccus contaminans TaxID=1945662 RepID=A0A1W6CZ03_9RHOB|nr:hypothetical protein [Paracoccus contaminans]ARJ70084.1 hypothetical protein B0A89_11010 [Paracoccus contaminans]